jgi:hypothetical protein
MICIEEMITQVGAAALIQFETELLENAEKNWLPSQVKMLRALIECTLNGTDYSEEYEKIQCEP